MIGRWRLPGVGHPGVVFGILAVILGTRHLSWRYHTSAAYEFPVAFSLFTLLWCSAVTLLLAAWTLPRHGRSRVLREVFPRILPTVPLCFSVVAVVLRMVLFGSTRQYMQCEVEGIYAFLPAAIVAIEVATLSLLSEYAPGYLSLEAAASKLAGPSIDELPESKASDGAGAAATRGPLIRYTLISLAYGFVVHLMLVSMQRPVGSICPSYNGANLLVPAAQIAMVALDAAVVAQVARWRRRAEDSSNNTSWVSLAATSLLSACILGVIAMIFAVANVSFGPFAHLLQWAPSVEKLILHDLVLDSAVVAVVLVSSAALLGSIQPASLVAVTLAAGILFSYVKQLKEERPFVILPDPGHAVWPAGAVGLGTIVVLVFFLVRSDSGLRHVRTHSTQKWQPRPWWQLVCYFGFVAGLVLYLHSQRPDNGSKALGNLVQRARDLSDDWMRHAGQSKSLAEAVEHYQLRYLMPPPPNFDKWYTFATAHNSPIIDAFDQIHSDLLPFWGVPPAVLREHTTHLLEQTRAGFGGFSIRNHTIKLSPLTPGSHFWMMDGYREMVEPYVQFLPDLDMAFNIDDECRVVVPFKDVQKSALAGSEAQARIPSHGATTSFSTTLEPPLTERHLEEGFKEAHKDDPLTPFITFRHKFHSVFDTYIAPTCHPSSPAHLRRWWSRKECSPPGRGVVEDVDWSVDVCHRPDLARMHGYLLDPAILGVSSATLLPVFSQSRVAGYNDILVPSPWNFFEKVKLDEAADMPWAEKLNSVFWRGSASDGASRHGTWTSFLRARFAHLAQLASARRTTTTTTKGSIPASSGKVAAAIKKMNQQISGRARSEQAVVVNASFVGHFGKNSRSDNRAQNTAFYGSPEADPPAGLDFQEHWRHRHLVDLDGAAFSGRFIPFLQSRSLPYRAALFRTWYEERVHAWRHYVPLDVSLNNLWGLVGEMDRVGGGRGEKSMGEEIALEGREWACRALRKEDHQIYMFRLLLEWARLIDDNRETLGFSVP